MGKLIDRLAPADEPAQPGVLLTTEQQARLDAFRQFVRQQDEAYEKLSDGDKREIDERWATFERFLAAGTTLASTTE